MVYITYYRPLCRTSKFKIIKYEGPYQIVLDSREDAMEWLKLNNIDNYNLKLVKIDIM